MSWKTKSVMEQKTLFIKMWQSGDVMLYIGKRKEKEYCF